MGNLVAHSVEFDLQPHDPAGSLWLFYKFEAFFAALLVILLIPVGTIIGLIILFLSRRSPLVRHRRVGWKGEELRVLKFRTMWTREPRSGPLLVVEDLPEVDHFVKTENDDRIGGRFVAWCRRHSLDEIPQLVHVACGKMSFVGPRPITRAELNLYYGDCAAEVLALRPGLTGLWQVMGRNRLSYLQRRRLDLWLVRRASPRLLLALLFKTIPRVLRGDGAY